MATTTGARVPPVALPPGPWEGARHDDLDAQRLAADHSAGLLISVARDHPQHAEAALRALRHVSNGEIALADLALMARESLPLRRTALTTLVALARRPPSDERLDAAGLLRCIGELQALSRDAAAAREDRALAVSALRGFARSGFVDPANITSDLDAAGQPSPAP